jgi:hypothetical protein
MKNPVEILSALKTAWYVFKKLNEGEEGLSYTYSSGKDADIGILMAYGKDPSVFLQELVRGRQKMPRIEKETIH